MLNFIKIENFSNKVAVKRMKRQDTDWGKYIGDKGTVSKNKILKTQQ